MARCSQRLSAGGDCTVTAAPHTLNEGATGLIALDNAPILPAASCSVELGKRAARSSCAALGRSISTLTVGKLMNGKEVLIFSSSARCDNRAACAPHPGACRH